MYAALTTLIDRLDGLDVSQANVIKWGCPVPSFGDLSRSQVATLGLNPSNREFVDDSGKELRGMNQRFPTLTSLKIRSWADADASHLKAIVESCSSYFSGNPYDRWFRRLDEIVLGTKTSFYDSSRHACHLDLIPYATVDKWTNLLPSQRKTLLQATGDTLGLLLRDSPVNILILNGRTVVTHFQEMSGVRLAAEEIPEWSLPRVKQNVPGIAYTGIIDSLSDISLGRNILVLGYNHNLQSSFGVTKIVINNIREWVKTKTCEVNQ